MDRPPSQAAQRAEPRGVERGNGDGSSRREPSFLTTAPKIELPKGGGAIRGIGEKFAANPVTGTGSMSVPIFASPGRAGFGPQLALTYDSGAGNGPFGLGWSLALPAITRKTDKGLPRYLDGVASDSDVFLLAGAEDLVPVLVQADDGWQPQRLRHDLYGQGYRVELFRPRVEGLFARVERWTHVADLANPTRPSDPSNVFWRTMSRDNVTTWYGRTVESRIFDPADRARIFSWLPCETHDDKGNVMAYEYKEEDSLGVDVAAAHERNRTPASRSANRYLKRIRYGNTTPYFPTLAANEDATLLPPHWLFELVFDYGDHDEDAPSPVDTVAWPCRRDPFSTHRAGFEVRTYRLCRRVLMFHHFPDDPEVGNNSLVRSTRFDYREPAAPGETSANHPTIPGYTVLAQVQQVGHRTRPGHATVSRELPPLAFTYSQPVVGDTAKSIEAGQLENLPVGTQGPGYQWIDLDGEGLPGVLSEQNGSWIYKPNLGQGCFGPSAVVHEQPALAAHAPGAAQLMDVDGNGLLELVSLQDMPTGFHERDADYRWRRFIPFASLPNIDWNDANLRFLDLSGDGHADALLTEDEAFTWYPSLAREGYAAAERVPWALDDEQGPRLVFADGTQTVFLADMCGDGMTDLVRIRNGEVCWWPNLGYGRFGARVTLDNAPRFDHDDLYDPRRIRLADIDGSGPADLIYLGRDGARLYFNRSGNRLSDAHHLDLPVATENLAAVQVADLLGAGTACLVWNSHLPADAVSPARYIELMADGKPHLLRGVDNNLGGSTQIDYTPSTRFYVADKLAGTPWITRLPFPVHCVTRVTVCDKWRGTAFSSSYSYHHGHFDGIEREFRGFGRVEQVDAEDYARFAQDNAGSLWITEDWRLFQPPVKTVTWFHTGVADDRDRVLTGLADEYFPARHRSLGIAEHALPDATIEAAFDPDFARTLDDHTWREALRACRGMVLRQETYELDPRALAEAPPRQLPTRLYGTATHNCHIRCLQPRAGNRHAVFHVTESEALTYQYELPLPEAGAPANPEPRITHSINLRVDDLGNVLQAVAIGYGRPGRFEVESLGDPSLDDASFDARTLQTIREVQAETRIAYNESRYTADLEVRVGDLEDPPLPEDTPLLHRRLRLPCEVRTFELARIERSAGAYFTLDDFARLGLSDRYTPSLPVIERLPYHRLPQPGGPPQRREVEVVCSLYFDDSDGIDRPIAPLPLGEHGPRGLKYEDYKLALTDELLHAVLRIEPPLDGVPTDLLDLLSWELDAGGPTARDVLNDTARSGYVRGSELAARFGVPPTDLAGQYWLRSGIAGFAENANEHYYLPERYTDPFDATTTLTYDAHDLYVASSADALENRVAVTRFDHRVLAPLEIEDMNGNHTEACFDILGRVIAVALKGKRRGDAWEGDDLAGLEAPEQVNPAPDAVQAFCTATTLDDSRARAWLRRAGTRFVYHFGEARNAAGDVVRWADRPAMACAIVRERHPPAGSPDTSPLQVALECADGSGAVLMKKQQAEPDPAIDPHRLRWIVNGLTVLNNKGKPVKQYEPFFSADFGCQMPEEHGVTPLLYYDAAGRLVRTEMPDGTLSRVEFSPWQQRSFDAGDTVLESPWYRDHPALFPIETRLPTNAAGHVTVAPGVRARWLSAQHANTPSLTVFDSLGREVMAIVHNRVRHPDGTHRFGGEPFRDEFYPTFTRLDAEGKPLWIRDARGNLVMQYVTPTKPVRWEDDPSELVPTQSSPSYDIAGNLLFQHSMDAGSRWMLSDAAGQPLLAWDFNDRQADDGSMALERRLASTEYDGLHRPVAKWLRFDNREAVMTERLEYRDTADADTEAALHNLIGCAVRHFDPSGLMEVLRCDFNGNVQHERRRLNNRPTEAVIDWQREPETLLESETFTRMTEHDALGRMTRLYNWHRGIGSRVGVYEPLYGARGLLQSEDLVIGANKTSDSYDPFRPEPGPPRPAERTTAISEIAYNAKGQRERVGYGNETATTYEYDTHNSRLTRLITTRTRDRATLQDLQYTYDPAGNIVAMRDDAQQTVYFANSMVEPHCQYEYDALYRLVLAKGREHAAQNNFQRDGRDFEAITEIPFPNSPEALQNYTETYQYDPVGNFLRMRHVGGTVQRWTRRYEYAEDSNRLSGTSLPGDADDAYSARYRYDRHGSMLNFANVSPGQFLRWDYRDMIHALDRIGGGWAYYNYDASKQRMRKRLDRLGETVEERLYLGGMEVYRSFDAAGGAVFKEIETHHLSIDDRRVLLVEDVLVMDDGDQPLGELLRYQYSNHLGSVSLELNQRGDSISYEEYHPYGTASYQASSKVLRSSAKRYRYTGMERDQESGLSYHAARYYAAWMGRWCGADDIGIRAGVNLYSYCLARPLSLVDASGHQSTTRSTRAMTSTEISMAWGTVDLLRSDLSVSAEDRNTVVGMLNQAIQSLENAPDYLRQAVADTRTALTDLVRQLQSSDSIAALQESLDSMLVTLEGAQGAVDFGVDADQLRIIAPNLSNERASELVPHINQAMRRFSIQTREQQAMFLAQTAHESGGFMRFREGGSEAHLNVEYSGKLGNVLPDDGSRYRGRGAIQITGRELYRVHGQRIGLDLEGNPSLAEQDDVAFLVSASYWSSRIPPSIAWFNSHRASYAWGWIPTSLQGQTLNQIAQSGTGEGYDYASVGINPGIPYERIALRRRRFDLATRGFHLPSTASNDYQALQTIIDDILR